MPSPRPPATGAARPQSGPGRSSLLIAAALAAVLGSGLSACAPAANDAPQAVRDAATVTPQNNATPNAQSADGPRGFLDPAPPPPTSDTIILSGGTLIADAVSDEHPDGLFDAVVVIQDGRLVGYGKRGSVEVPDDSVGVDTSGRFIVPVGTTLHVGQPIALAVYAMRPAKDADSRATALFGTYRDGVWERLAPADD